MKISIIIASYNRAQLLRHFLQEISLQIVPNHVKWEVLVVDNHSVDETKNVVESYVSANPQRFRYIFEGRRGKSPALNTGIQNSTGDILVFTDDDCLPDATWLRAIANEFESDSSLAVLGGRVELYCKEDWPVTIRTYRERIPFSSVGQLFSLILGCNMAIRRSVVDAVGDFDLLLGPGTKMGAVAEDSDFLYRVFKKGFKLVYSPDVLVYHNHGRKTDAQVQALNHKYVVGRGAFYSKHIFRADLCVLKMAYWEVSALIKGLISERFTGKAARERKTLLRDLFVGFAYLPPAFCWNLARRLAKHSP
jgi:glycosyltransferase involved in cell wall biosynthesis